MNPFTKTKDTSYIMDNIQKSIINEISDDVGKLSVVVGEEGDCSELSVINNYGTNFKEVLEEKRKYIIYYNEMFGGGSITDCDIDGIVNYSLGTYSIEKMIMKQKIIDLVDSYGNNYEDLKKSLGITNDFLFEIRDLLGTKNETLSVGYSKNIPTGIDIEAREIPIRVIKNDGTIIEKKLYIQAW